MGLFWRNYGRLGNLSLGRLKPTETVTPRTPHKFNLLKSPISYNISPPRISLGVFLVDVY